MCQPFASHLAQRLPVVRNGDITRDQYLFGVSVRCEHEVQILDDHHVLGDHTAGHFFHTFFMLIFEQPVAHADEIDASVVLINRSFEHVLMERVGGCETDVSHELVRTLEPRARCAHAQTLTYAGQRSVFAVTATKLDVMLVAQGDLFDRLRGAVLLGR